MTKEKFKIVNIKENPQKSVYEITVHFNYLWESVENKTINEEGEEIIETVEGYTKTDAKFIEVPLIMTREQILSHLKLIYKSVYDIKSDIEQSLKSVLDLKGYSVE